MGITDSVTPAIRHSGGSRLLNRLYRAVINNELCERTLPYLINIP